MWSWLTVACWLYSDSKKNLILTRWWVAGIRKTRFWQSARHYCFFRQRRRLFVCNFNFWGKTNNKMGSDLHKWFVASQSDREKDYKLRCEIVATFNAHLLYVEPCFTLRFEFEFNWALHVTCLKGRVWNWVFFETFSSEIWEELELCKTRGVGMILCLPSASGDLLSFQKCITSEYCGLSDETQFELHRSMLYSSMIERIQMQTIV